MLKPHAKFHANPVGSFLFLVKLFAYRQANEQTGKDENVTSLFLENGEVNDYVAMIIVVVTVVILVATSVNYNNLISKNSDNN